MRAMAQQAAMDFFCLRYGLIMDPFVQPHRAVWLTVINFNGCSVTIKTNCSDTQILSAIVSLALEMWSASIRHNDACRD